MAQTDVNRYRDQEATGHAVLAAAITTADNVDLPFSTRAGIWVGVAGDVAFVARDAPLGAPPVILKNVPVGRLGVWARQVWQNGTTATQLVALG